MKKMMRMLALFLLEILTACGEKEDWEHAPQNYVCDERQLALATIEADYCLRGEHFNGRYCYGLSVIHNCTRKNDVKDKIQKEKIEAAVVQPRGANRGRGAGGDGGPELREDVGLEHGRS